MTQVELHSLALMSAHGFPYMSNYTITLSEAHDTMLKWAATVRHMTVDQVIGDTLVEFLRPLEARYMAAHKDELAILFEQLSIPQQLTIIDSMKLMVTPP